MAEQHVATFSNKPISAKQKDKDFEEHSGTYKAFLQLVKWGIIANVIILAVLYFLFIF
ncbi:aa3-type cytochrome c oxidase subunit IV [Pelagibacterium limicola]|uniref:aa3-type cytochrome c oxidase subunit IV n=1 Tax=Pelagibacterium limicola TaxID=2791022 RepID=UPI0018AFCD64|nr:aa3-type cytochrome c oxidase subunit IV [Pelagibacterium limicola]